MSEANTAHPRSPDEHHSTWDTLPLHFYRPPRDMASRDPLGSERSESTSIEHDQDVFPRVMHDLDPNGHRLPFDELE